MDLTLLETTLRERGEPAYRAGQVWDWAARGAAGYEDMIQRYYKDLTK